MTAERNRDDDRWPQALLAGLVLVAALSLAAGLALGAGGAFGRYAGLGLAGVFVFGVAARGLGALLGRRGDAYDR